jgi:hypothetical protein
VLQAYGIELAKGPERVAILARYGGGRLMLLAPGYPRPWLLALAANLAQHCFQGEWEQGPEPRGGSVEGITSAGETSGFRERHDQPAGSSVVVLERRADQVILYVPPLGLWRGGGCLLLFGLVWLGAAFFCLLAAWGVIVANGNAWLAFGNCLLVSLVVLLLAIHFGYRWAVLTVAGKTLWVRTGGLWGDRERSWRREEIEDIRIGHGGTGDDSTPLELQIHLKRRLNPKCGFLGGRRAEELAWVATVLRHALRLPHAGQRAESFTRTKDNRIQAAPERPTATATDERIRRANEHPTRSTSFRPKRPQGE